MNLSKSIFNFIAGFLVINAVNVLYSQCTPGPNANFSFTGGNNQCANTPNPINNTSTGTNLTYQWDFGNPASGTTNTSTLQNPIHKFISFGEASENFSVQLIVTDVNGCKDTVVKTITKNQTPGASLIDPATEFLSCDSPNPIFNLTVFDNSVSQNNSNYQIIWGDATTNFSNATFPGAGVNHSYVLNGVFDLTYIVTGNNTCKDTIVIPVANTQNPSVGLTSLGNTTGCTPLNVCLLTTTGLNHSTTIYIADYGDGSPIDTFTHAQLPAQICHTYLDPSCPLNGNTGYTFSLLAVNLCSSTLATIGGIKVSSPPIADVDANPLVGCVNSVITFSNATQLGYGSANCSRGTTFTWDFGDGSPLQTNTSSSSIGNTHIYTNPGIYDVVLSASNSTCGSSTDTIRICIEAPPIPNFTATPIIGCVPLNVTTNNTSSIANVCSVTRNWNTTFDQITCNPSSGTRNFTNGTDALSLEPQFVFTDPGLYSINLVMSNTCGNITHTQNIIAQAPPDISINPVTSICGGETISPTAIYNDCQELINTYLWNFPGATVISSNQEIPGTFTYQNNGAFTITLTATNDCGSDVATTNLTVNDVPPIVNPFTISPLCAGYDAAFFSDTVLNATYNWTGPNGFISNIQNPIITNVSSNHAGTYSVFASFGTCQGASQSIDLIILPITVVDAGNDISNCIDDSPFTISPVTPPGGVWSGNGINAAGLFNPILAGSGVHTIRYTITDPVTNCVYFDELIATVNVLPIVNAGSDISLCNQPIANTLTPITPLNGVWSGPGITNPTGEFTPSVNGSFEIFYSFTDLNGCFNEDTLIVDVIDPTNADAGSDTTTCENGIDIQLNATPIGGTWSGSGISANGIFDPTVPGNFTMTYSFGSGTCQTNDEMEIFVNPAPVVVAGQDFTICLDGGIVDLSASPNLLGGTWSGTGISNPNGDFDPFLAGNGTHILTYTYLDPVTNCSNSDILSANVIPLPFVNAGNDTVLCNQPLPVQFNGLPVGGTWTGPNVDVNGEFIPNGVGVFTLYYSFTLSSCEAIDSIEVTVVDPSQADAGSDLELCFSNTLTQFVGLPNGGTWTGIGIASNGDYTPNNPGTYEMVYSFGGGTCLTRDTMQLIVHALPAVDAGLNQEFCESDFAVNFAGSPLNGTWTGPGIVNSVFGTFDPSAANNNGFPNKIVYTFTDLNNCSNTDTLDAIVHELPTVLFSYNPIVCVGVLENFTNNSLLGDQFSWNFGDNTGLNFNENPTHSYSNSGFFDIKLIVTSIFGCVDSLIQNIEVRELPNATYLILPDSACGSLQANFTNNSTGIGPIDYDWNFGNGQSSTLQDPGTVIYQAGILADTLYFVSLSLTNFCGTVSKNDTVKVMPKPTAIFGTLFDSGCSPYTADFANTSIGLPDNYAWDFGNGITSTTSAGLFSQVFTTGANDTIYTIRLIVSNECGADTAFHNIQIFPTSVNSFFNTNATQGCAPLTVNFTSISAGATQFNWDFGDGNVSNQNTSSNTFVNAGTYTVRLIVNDDCSKDTSFATITVHPQPNIDFSFTPQSACTNVPFTFTNLSTGVSNISWDFGDGSTSNLTNPVHSYVAAGNYIVTLNGISTLFGCQSSITKNLSVVTSPIASFNIPPANGCVPATFVFNNTSSNFSFVTWNFGDGNFSAIQNPNHAFNLSGNYTVKLIVENTIGCKDSTTSIVQVFPIPTADFNFISIDSCHLPSQVVTNNTSSGAIDFVWNMGNGINSNLSSPTVFYNIPGTYFVKLVASNQYFCKDSIIKDLTIFQPPKANFILSNYSLCRGEVLTGTSLSTQNNSVIWYMGDGTTLTGNTFTHTYKQAGDYFVTLVAIGDGNCTDTSFSTKPVNIKTTPSANFDYINVEESDLTNGLIEFKNLSSNANSYLWIFENDSTSTQVNPSYKFDHYGNEYIILYAYNNNGCKDSIRKLININYYKGLFVPNAMNPAHPNFEVSHFLPKGVGLHSYHLMIFDDWGNLIFETTKLDLNGRPTEAWDGMFKGEPVQQDAYVWKIDATYLTSGLWEGKEYPDGRFKKAGTITVIR